MDTVTGCAEIRLWRVGGAIHANIPRSVVAEPPLVDHRPGRPAPIPDRGQHHDLALNILNLFVPPDHADTGESMPVKCYRGHCSAFAARHHEAFARAFIDPLPAAGGSIDSGAIVAWIGQRRVRRVSVTVAA